MWPFLLGLGLPLLYAGLVLTYARNLVDAPAEDYALDCAGGHVPLTIAAVALSLFLLTGLTASRTSRTGPRRSVPTPGTPGRAD